MLASCIHPPHGNAYACLNSPESREVIGLFSKKLESKQPDMAGKGED
jgi:hypothetical protein